MYLREPCTVSQYADYHEDLVHNRLYSRVRATTWTPSILLKFEIHFQGHLKSSWHHNRKVFINSLITPLKSVKRNKKSKFITDKKISKYITGNYEYKYSYHDGKYGKISILCVLQDYHPLVPKPLSVGSDLLIFSCFEEFLDFSSESQVKSVITSRIIHWVITILWQRRKKINRLILRNSNYLDNFVILICKYNLTCLLNIVCAHVCVLLH
jgi:hypothetical protein